MRARLAANKSRMKDVSQMTVVSDSPGGWRVYQYGGHTRAGRSLQEVGQY